MRNSNVIYLVNSGILSISNHELSADNAYKVFKFKKAIRTAYEKIGGDENGFMSAEGITDPAAFDQKLIDLRRNDPESEELKEMESVLKRIADMRVELYAEDTELEGIKALPYEQWNALQNENRATKCQDGITRDILSGDVEAILENILWLAPNEE